MVKMKKLNSEEVKALLDSIEELINIKIIIRNIAPSYFFNEEIFQSFISNLENLYKNLKPIFSKFLQLKELEFNETSDNLQKRILKKMSDQNIAMVSSNSSKKVLKNIGVDPRNLIVTGGPLFSEDYKIINPSLSKAALKGIEKKCKRIFNQIKNQNWKDKSFIFIFEEGNPTDLLILKKLNEIENIIGKKAKIIKLKSWKTLAK